MDRPNRRLLIIGAAIGLAGIPLGIAGAYGFKAATTGVKSVAGKRRISAYMQTHEVRMLQISAGGVNAFPGWLNTDIDPADDEAYLDATRPFPIPDGALNYVFSEHVFEHLAYQDGLTMLRECHRTLKPGGKVRIATPNLLSLIRLFQESKTDEMRTYIDGKLRANYWKEALPLTISPECVILNYELKSWGHQFVYDPKTLTDSLERTGFTDIKQFSPGASDDPQLAGLEWRHKRSGHEMNDYETMVFQAVRR
jgi:predicted SAM-dependent methyltransferase